MLPPPLGEGWGWGHAALDPCIAIDSSPEPGIRPGGRVTFFVSPKKVTKERRPHCACPSASLRATCGARVAGPPQNSLRSLRSLRSNSCGESDHEHACPSAGVWPATLRSSARAEGSGTGHRFARPPAASLREAWNRCGRARANACVCKCKCKRKYSASKDLKLTLSCTPHKDAPWRVGIQNPLWPRRGAELFADQGRACLSEASLRGPREKRAPQVARSEAEGRGQWGRLSLVTFFGETKKVTRPPGRIPGSGIELTATHRSSARVPPPQPSPRGGGSKTATPAQRPKSLTPALSPRGEGARRRPALGPQAEQESLGDPTP